jgi:hypothetical protein
MKITKTFISVFIAAFLFGYASVPPERKIVEQLQESETVSKSLPVPQNEKKSKLETLKEINNWIDEENYSFKIKLLETGEGFHGDEVEAKSGEKWLGLFKENDGYFMRFSELKVSRVHDPIVDDNEKIKTGKSISLKNNKTPIFLLKNAGTLQEGKITTLFQGLTWKDFLNSPEESNLNADEVLTVFKKDFVQKYKLGGNEYKLQVVEAKNEKDEKILALILESEATKQILHTLNADYNSDLGNLYWVGDLDRDGKPDFYMDLYVHYNAGNKVLFLSSQAERGKLVKKVAYFWTTGC